MTISVVELLLSLLDRASLKSDPDYDKAVAAQRPVLLIDLTDKHTLLQTAEKYPCAVVYEHECNLYGYQQNQIADQQYCTTRGLIPKWMLALPLEWQGDILYS